MEDNEDKKATNAPDKKDDVKKTKAKKPEKDKDEALVKNTIEVNPTLKEATGKTVVLGWGRMNPITTGHEKLANKIKDVAAKNRAAPMIFLTHSQDPKKNPLSYADKVRFANKAFGGNIVVKSNANTIIKVMQQLEKSYSDVILVVGQDRVSDFETLLNRYNGKDYSFNSIKVVSAGDRDPDADDVTGMSASKMRALASQGNFDDFKKGLPRKLQSNAKNVYDMVRVGMKLAEELEEQGLLGEVLDREQRRKRALTMRRYKSKIVQARKRSMKKPPTKEKLLNRARKQAINIIRKKVAANKNASYSELDATQKMLIDKKVAKRKKVIDRIAKRMLNKVRQADLARRQGKKLSVNEQFEALLESYDNPPTKRFHEVRKKDGSIKLDRRFRAFKSAAKPMTEDPELDRMKASHKQEREILKRAHDSEMDRLVMRKTRERLTKTESTHLKIDNDSLLKLIESISEDIQVSVDLEESKIQSALQKKADSANISYEELKSVFDNALSEEGYDWAFSCVNAYVIEAKNAAQQAAIAIAKKEKEAKEEVELDSFFDLNEQFELLEASILDKALAAIHKHVTSGADLGDMSYQVSRAKGVTFSSQDLRKKYIAKFGNPSARKADPKAVNDLKRRYGFKEYAEQYGAGFEGTDTAIQNFKADTPGEKGTKKKPKISDWSPNVKDAPMPGVNEAFEALLEDKCDLIGLNQIKQFEKFVDRMFEKFGIDFNFTKHFGERMSDGRNDPCITMKELANFITKIYKNQGKSIKGVAGAEAVIKDIQSDLNIPVAVKYDINNDEFDVVMKTIMRKKNFKTPNKVIKY